ncbi:MAG: beta-N-acetylglucosaminidase domain-containing protein, partial [Candidatus Aminicenantes bacterium]|nr:beta-N-acetylglucosaminidase domain-containing protein [Candidatus Aminicenantes bacterium]
SCEKIKNKKQAYLIQYLEALNTLFLKGSDPIGNYYAAATAVQLLDRKDFIYHHADILDYPDFLGRSYLFDSWNSTEKMKDDISSIQRMSLYKLNKAYVGYGQTRGRRDWYAPDDLYRTGVRKAGQVCRNTGVMDLAIMINPYYHFDYEMKVQKMSKELRYTWRHGNPKDMQTLKNVFKIGLDVGAKCIMLMGDDFVPHESDYRKIYSLWTPEDKAQFITLQNAQAFMINELYTWLTQNYKGTRFEFCPPWYLNEFIDKSRGRAEQYFEDLILQIPDNVAVIWTGNTVRSLSYDMADIERYRKLIGRYPMLWDNTLYARGLTGNYGGYARYYPGKVRMCNLFEPMDLFLPNDFYKYNHGAHMYTNGSAFTETYKIKYTTVADFEWNNNEYNADFSLWKALLSQFGKDLALKLLKFNDAYYGLVDMCLRIEKTDNDQEFIKRGLSFIEDLKSHFNAIDRSLPDNRKLVFELKGHMDGQISVYNKLASGKKEPQEGKPQI